MKLAITGHTSGIGKALYNHYSKNGHECIGFSRLVGYDITDATSRAKIVAESEDCMVFINNAGPFGANSQLHMLEDMYAAWTGKDKLIINIGAKITDKELPPEHFLHKYREKKLEQELFCLNKNRWPWVLNIKPGLVDTPLSDMSPKLKDRPGKMNPDVVVTVLDFVIKNRAAFRTTSITMEL